MPYRMSKWKRPWGRKKPPEDKSYLCVFNDGGDGDDHLNVGFAYYDSDAKGKNKHLIIPEWLNSCGDESMRYWKELPELPKDVK